MPALSSYYGLYKSLEVSPTASHYEIRKAYREKALVTHPDRAPPDQKVQAAEAFRTVQTAYEILSDEDERREYDAILRDVVPPGRRVDDIPRPPSQGRLRLDPRDPRVVETSLKESFHVKVSKGREQICYRIEDQNGNIWEMKNDGPGGGDSWTRNGEPCLPPEGSEMRADWVRQMTAGLQRSRTANFSANQSPSSNGQDKGGEGESREEEGRQPRQSGG